MHALRSLLSRETATWFGIGAVGAFAGIVLFTLLQSGVYPEAKTIGNDVTSFDELSERFESLAKEKGGVYAFGVLKKAPLPPQTDLHLLGHVVGDELYKQQGVDGIRLCTPDFRNACSHSIVIGTLAEFGEESLPMIRDACKEAPGGSGAYTMCFHGLGHGVFAGYGYELEPTINFCKQTGTEEYNQQEYIECFGGAVMELTGGGGHDTELWEKAREKYLTSPLAPCVSEEVPDELKSICLTYLTPQIWEAAGVELGRPDPELFSQAFAYCENIPSSYQGVREACYAGFGKEFVPLAGARDIRDISSYSNDDFSRAIGWCLYAEQEDGTQWCINEGLDSIFWGGESDPEASFRYCSLVDAAAGSQYTAGCYETLSSNINFYIHDVAERNALCAQLPEDTAKRCTSYE